jgi:hypothetical protein
MVLYSVADLAKNPTQSECRVYHCIRSPERHICELLVGQFRSWRSSADFNSNLSGLSFSLKVQ